MAEKNVTEETPRSQENQERKTETRGKRVCPIFKGIEGEDYDMWRKRVMLWYKIEGRYLECPGGEIMLSLGEKAFQSVSDIELEEIGRQEGMEKVLEVLDKRFGKEKSRDRYDKILEFFKIRRN